MALRETLRRRPWLVAVPVVVIALVVLGPFLYINVIRDDPAERLSLDDRPAAAADGADTDGGDGPDDATLDGTWTATEGSQAGYRAGEVLFGQSTEGVGRTTDVTGSVVLEGTTVAEAGFEVDLTTVTSDEANRDNQFRGRIMDVANHPTATFVLAEAVTLDRLPGEGQEVTVPVAGDLTARGVTRRETFELRAVYDGGVVRLVGAIPVTWADYGIPDPSFGPARVEPTGEIEFLLVLDRD